jgi:CRISPR-associated protein Csy1
MNRQQKPLFLRLLASCDVVLDSPDWSGGLTAIDCFSQKTPFVTLPGPYFRQRLGVGIARKAGGEGLIASSAEDYLDLATNPDRIHEAMRTVDPERLYGDLAPVRALEKHVLGVAG